MVTVKSTDELNNLLSGSGSTKVTELAIENVTWTNLPAEVCRLTQLKSLSILGVPLIELPAEIGELGNLENLSVNRTKITTIHPSIGKLTRLNRLELIFNDGLSALPYEIFSMSSLVHLDLRGNNISILLPEIEPLENPEALVTGSGLQSGGDNRPVGNSPTTPPPEIGSLSNLQFLALGNNKLKQLPTLVGNLLNLKNLGLEANLFSEFPKRVLSLAGLEILDLRNNQLTSLPVEIGSLEGLKTLDLGGNQLPGLPPEIGKLSRLQKLDLSENRLSSLPSEIGRLVDLRVLDLTENRLSSLPPTIGTLKKLRYLMLNRNQLHSLPPELGALEELEVLLAQGNQLETIPRQIGELRNLRELHLDGNQLSYVPHEIGELRGLKVLTLESNRLKNLPLSIASLTQLQKLSLRRNQLESPDAVLRQEHNPRAIIRYELLSPIARELARESADFRQAIPDLECPLFTTAYPEVMVPATWYSLALFIYIKKYAKATEREIQQIRQREQTELGDVTFRSTGILPEGCNIVVTLSSDDIDTNPSQLSIRWFEGYYRFPFRIRLKKAETLPASATLTLDISADGLPVVSLPLVISVGAHSEIKQTATTDVPWPRDIFASYSRVDKKIVMHLKESYKALGIYMFVDTDDIHSGEFFEEVLVERIAMSDLFQLFWSTTSSQSQYVRFEWEHALELIPVKGKGFVRPVYWEEPLPTIPMNPNNPNDLSKINFYKLTFDPSKI